MAAGWSAGASPRVAMQSPSGCVKSMDVHDARAAEHLFDLRAAVAVAQHPRQGELTIRSRREVGVTRFGGDRQPSAVHGSAGSACRHAGPRGDHRRVALRPALAVLQHDELVLLEDGDAVCHRLEVVEQADARRLEPPRDLVNRDVPRDVRQPRALIDDRTGDADRGGLHRESAGVAREVIEDGREARELLRRVGTREHLARARLAAFEETEQRLGPSKVAGEDHEWIIVNAVVTSRLSQHLEASVARALQARPRRSPALHAEVGTRSGPPIARTAKRCSRFPTAAIVRQADEALGGGATFRAVFRNLLASRDGQLAFDFRIEAQHAKVLQLKRREPPPMAALMDSTPRVEDSSAGQYFLAGSILDDGSPENFEEASQAYRRALEIDPYLVPALVNLANIHYSRDSIAEAQALYERAIGLEPDVFEAHFNLGNIFHDLGRYRQAQACYREALKLNPTLRRCAFLSRRSRSRRTASRTTRAAHWKRLPAARASWGMGRTGAGVFRLGSMGSGGSGGSIGPVQKGSRVQRGSRGSGFWVSGIRRPPMNRRWTRRIEIVPHLRPTATGAVVSRDDSSDAPAAWLVSELRTSRTH